MLPSGHGQPILKSLCHTLNIIINLTCTCKNKKIKLYFIEFEINEAKMSNWQIFILPILPVKNMSLFLHLTMFSAMLPSTRWPTMVCSWLWLVGDSTRQPSPVGVLNGLGSGWIVCLAWRDSSRKV